MSFVSIKKGLYKYFFSLSLFFLDIALKLNNHTLCAFILLINIAQFKKINCQNQKKKKILIFPKSGGNEDLIETYNNNNNNNIVFYLLPRIFLKKIFHYHFKNTDKSKYHSDYYTKPKNLIEIERKKHNIKFLTKCFGVINFFLKLNGIISFNLFYYNEKYFEEVCKNLNIKFIILHKESVFTPYDEKNMSKIYKNYNEKSLSYKISVYSQNQKKILIQSKIATRDQVVVNGCPRSDYAFRLRKVKPKNKYIIFYLIEYERGTHKHYGIKINFNKLLNQTLDCLLDFAKKQPNINIILKGKTGIHKKKQFSSKFFPKNCTFIEGGAGEKLLKDAAIVIAFNSTIVFETIASNRNLIIPNFNSENVKKEQFVHKIKDKKYYANSKKQFNKKVIFYLNSKYKNEKITNADKKTLKYYLGNPDGKSGERMIKFLKNSIIYNK